MKRITTVLLVLFLLFTANPNVRTLEDKKPSVLAEAYVLYCADNSQVILSGNLHKKLGCASTTKIMTSLLALEAAMRENTVVTFSEEMTAEGSSMYLKAGDRLKLSDLAKGMMTVSGNDAANAVALTLCDTFEDFSALMNKRAKEIGMENTHFETPSGLPSDNHYSTAYDLALLMQEAMNNEDFASLTSKKTVEVEFIKPSGQKVTYSNHNRLLSLYPDCIGGKTGYAKSTGRCLVTCSEREGLRLICVTLNASDDWNDHKALYEYGFSKYAALDSCDEKYPSALIGGENEFVNALPQDNATVVVSAEDKEKVHKVVYVTPCVFAPIKKGDTLGRVVYYLGEEIISETALVAEENVDRASLNFFKRIMLRVFGQG